MIIAIDPGTTNTGLVSLDRAEVWRAETISYPTAVGTDNEAMRERVRSILARVDEFAEHGSAYIEAFVIEGWAYFGGRANASSFQTPWLIGSLITHLEARYRQPVFVQLSSHVLNPTAPGNCAWVKTATKGGGEVVKDAQLCTNDHTRSALAHGIYFYQDPEHEEFS